MIRAFPLLVAVLVFGLVILFQDSVIHQQKTLIRQMASNPECMVDLPSR